MRLILAASGTLSGWAVGWCIGCQAPPPPAGPTVERIAVAPDEYDRLWETACEVLRRQAFSLDRVDRTNGVITTHPETTAQGFEFWRPQPEPAYYWGEANLHTIQRQATVRIEPADKPDEYTITVHVDRRRYRLEERQIDNAAAALRLYSADAPTAAGQMVKPSQSSQWVPLGRDVGLERAILSRILRRMGPLAVAATDDPAP